MAELKAGTGAQPQVSGAAVFLVKPAAAMVKLSPWAIACCYVDLVTTVARALGASFQGVALYNSQHLDLSGRF